MENCKWYNKKIKQLSNKLWLPIESNYNKANFDYQFNSNCGINFDAYTPQEENKISIIKPLSINQKGKKQIIKKYIKKLKKCKNDQLKNILNDEVKNINKIIRNTKISLNFNEQQQKIIFSWFKECDKVYNECIKIYNNKDKKFDYNYKKLKLIVFKKLYNNQKKSCPYDILTDEVRIACSNIKSCLTNLKKGNIKHFEIKERSKYTFRSILIPKKSITNKGIYASILGKQNNKLQEEIICDSRFTYDFKTKKFNLLIPLYKEKIKITNRKKIVSLDPGEKIFMAFYSQSEAGKIGEDIRKDLLLIQQKIKKQQSALKRNKNKKEGKLKNKKILKEKIRKNYKKIKNKVKELHNQTAIFLCKNYERIMIPKFETQQMLSDKIIIKEKVKENNKKIMDVSKNAYEFKIKLKEYKRKTRLNGRVKFVLNNLSHYQFRQHLLNKCEEYGCELLIVTEEYTSKCCGKCGKISNNYKNRIKKCTNCGIKINRDINGARNILLKNSKLIF